MEKGVHMVVNNISQVKIDSLGRSGPLVPSALTSLKEIEKQIRGHGIAVFLDYDGTLTPIVDDPEKALIQEHMRNSLATLSNLCTVAVISGRDLSDVREKVGLDDIVYAGSHGFDIAGSKNMNVQSQRGEEFLPLLDTAEERLREQLESVEGALVERKKFSLAVHYRKVKKENVKTVEDIVDDVIHEQPRLRKSTGKKVFEVQPGIDWHKGKAMLWLIENMDLQEKDIVTFYIGDDNTDEDAFDSLPERGIGIAVMEKPRSTAARYVLKNPAEVEKFIRALAEFLGGIAEYDE